MQKGEPGTPCISKENERKGRRVGVRRGGREIERLIRLREAHASLVVGVGNVLTHERNRERRREAVRERDGASRVALMPGRPAYVCTVSRMRFPCCRGPRSLYIAAVGRRARERDPVASRARCHNHRATNGDAIAEIHVRSIATGDGLIRGKLLRGFRAVYSLSPSGEPPRAEDRFARSLLDGRVVKMKTQTLRWLNRKSDGCD